MGAAVLLSALAFMPPVAAYAAHTSVTIFEIEQHNGEWWLGVWCPREAAAEAFQQAVPGAEQSDRALRLWTVEHIRQTARFSVSGRLLTIGAAQSRMSARHVQVHIRLGGAPEALHSLTAAVTSFSHSPHHQNLVRFMAEGAQHRALLDQDRGFAATVWEAESSTGLFGWLQKGLASLPGLVASQPQTA